MKINLMTITILANLRSRNNQ